MKIKVAVIGDCCVGKTHFCNQLRNIQSNRYIPTIGVDFFKYIKDKDVLEIWDTSANSMYQSVIKTFIQNANILICLYKDFMSFQYIKDKITNDTRKYYIINVGARQDFRIENMDNVYYFNVNLNHRASVLQCVNLIVNTVSKKLLSHKNRSYCWFY